MLVRDVSKSTNVPIVNINKCSERELSTPKRASLPVMDGSIELIKHVSSTQFRYQSEHLQPLLPVQPWEQEPHALSLHRRHDIVQRD